MLPAKNMASSKKAEYMAYMDQSGGRQMLSKAIVALSKASLADSSVKPAVFLRDFFAGGKAGAGSSSADLSADDKERVSAYMKSSGANDLLTKALVALHDTADRPKNPGAFFSTYFTSEAPPPKPSPKKEPSGKDLKEKTPSAQDKEKTPSGAEAAAPEEPAAEAAAASEEPAAASEEPAAAAEEPAAAAEEPAAAAAEPAAEEPAPAAAEEPAAAAAAAEEAPAEPPPSPPAEEGGVGVGGEVGAE